MSDIQKMVDENADRARTVAEQAAAKHKADKIHKVNKQLFHKALVGAVLVLAVMLSMIFDLIVPILALPLVAGVMVWLALHFGAWLQYTGKGPLK